MPKDQMPAVLTMEHEAIREELGRATKAGGRIVREEKEAGLHGSTSSDQIEVVYERSRYFE